MAYGPYGNIPQPYHPPQVRPPPRPLQPQAFLIHPIPADAQGYSRGDGWGARRSHGGHKGMDLRAKHGTPILSVAAGVVADVLYNRGGAGHYVRILHDIMGQKIYGEYMHASAFPQGLKRGDRVEAGQVVAFTGATGTNGSRPHLHLQFLRPDGNGARGHNYVPVENIFPYFQNNRISMQQAAAIGPGRPLNVATAATQQPHTQAQPHYHAPAVPHPGQQALDAFSLYQRRPATPAPGAYG